MFFNSDLKYQFENAMLMTQAGEAPSWVLLLVHRMFRMGNCPLLLLAVFSFVGVMTQRVDSFPRDFKNKQFKVLTFESFQ